MAHGKFHISAGDLLIAESPFFSGSYAVERADDGIGELILFPGSLGKIFTGKFLETVGGKGRRTFVFIPFPAGEGSGTFIDHAGTQNIDFF